MKWLQDNPLGLALAACSGVLVLLALVMALVWSIPVSINVAGEGSPDAIDADQTQADDEVGALGDYRVINERPVFNESRRPVLAQLDGEDDELEDGAIEVKDAPDVRLTGVIITPAMKIASLTPANTALESVMAHEGQALTGEFVGWQVSTVNPRTVVLESRDGQTLELELQVHDSKIKEPPKPAQPAKTAQAGSARNAQEAGEDDEPLSRAEQIRQRIAERREELRLEQEAQSASDGGQGNGGRKAADTSNYQNAIRAMMKNKSKDQSSNDNKDG